MSKNKAREYINNAIQKEFKNFKTAREYLNISIHSLNISYSVFVTNNRMTNYKLSDSDLAIYYKEFITAVKRAVGVGKVFKSINEAASHINRDSLVSGPIVVRDISGMFLIGTNYDAVRLLLSQVVREQPIKASPLGVKQKISSKTGEIFYKSILQLGHTDKETPLAATIAAISNYTANTDKGNVLKQELDSALKRLVVNQPKVTYTYLNTANNVKLPEGIINIVVQPEDVNAKFSVEESKVYLQVLKSIREYLSVLDIPGSNTLRQDIVQFTSDKMLSALSGKKVDNIKPHSEIKGKVPLPNIGTKQKVIVSAYKELQTAQTRSTVNLVSLQLLINTHLQDVISANMGSGTAKNILNYQTGRFAASARVERMSQSREGMITAFYSYMKNPYQTFEPGFRQGSPKTRDPKLLIAGSIRDIAASKVDNRMRAVLI